MEPISLLSPLLAAGRAVSGRVIKALGRSDEPRLVIDVQRADRVVVNQSGWLDWQHIVVTNVGYPKAPATITAEKARASVTLSDGRKAKLLWDTPHGPKEERDLVEDDPQTIAFLICHRSGGGSGLQVYGYPLMDDQYYISDVQMLTQGARSSPPTLDPGRIEAEVTITYGKSSRTKQKFQIDIPAKGATERAFWRTVP